MLTAEGTVTCVLCLCDQCMNIAVGVGHACCIIQQMRARLEFNWSVRQRLIYDLFWREPVTVPEYVCADARIGYGCLNFRYPRTYLFIAVSRLWISQTRRQLYQGVTTQVCHLCPFCRQRVPKWYAESSVASTWNFGVTTSILSRS